MERDCPELHYHINVTQQTIAKQSYSKAHARQKTKRKNLRSRKEVLKKEENLMETGSIFKMFSGLNLGKLIIDIHRMEGQADLEL